MRGWRGRRVEFLKKVTTPGRKLSWTAPAERSGGAFGACFGEKAMSRFALPPQPMTRLGLPDT